MNVVLSYLSRRPTATWLGVTVVLCAATLLTLSALRRSAPSQSDSVGQLDAKERPTESRLDILQQVANVDEVPRIAVRLTGATSVDPTTSAIAFPSQSEDVFAAAATSDSENSHFTGDTTIAASVSTAPALDFAMLAAVPSATSESVGVPSSFGSAYAAEGYPQFAMLDQPPEQILPEPSVEALPFETLPSVPPSDPIPSAPTPPSSAQAEPSAEGVSSRLPAEAYRVGSFTKYGNITPADVRLFALRNNKDIAVVGHIPDIASTLIQIEQSVFDPVFNVAMNGGHYNRQTSTLIESMGTGIPTLKTSFWQPINGLNQVFVEKTFTTGGRIQAGVGQNFLNYSPAGNLVFINPAYQSSVNVMLEQPLFRGRGPAATLAMVQIAKANQAQSVQAFRCTVNEVLREAECAYWDTYAAYQDFEVRDLAFRQASETLDRERGRLQLGEGSVPDVAQAEEQYEAFHIARYDAENRLVAAQRNLRRLLGLPPGDPQPLIPSVAPSEAPLQLDWNYAAETALDRPEVCGQQAIVKAVEFELARRRNGLQPDLSIVGIYSVSGLSSEIEQAWKTTGAFDHNDWTAGVMYRQPLGRRSDRALADRAIAALALETSRLKLIEHEILHQLDKAHQNVLAAQHFLSLHRRRREAAAIQLTARRDLYIENRATLREQLDAELRYASAIYEEALARVNYQRALTEWNYARGAMLDGEIAMSP